MGNNKSLAQDSRDSRDSQYYPDYLNGSSHQPSVSIHMEPHPKIMHELADFLKQRNHSCVSIVGASNHDFTWCKKDECPKTLALNNMCAHQQEQDKLIEELHQKGHTCVSVAESYPVHVGWCNQDPCVNSK